MLNIENINENIRNDLEDIYIILQDKYDDTAGLKYYELMDELKENKPNVYETIISLMFLDTIRLLIDKDNKKFITNEEKTILQYLSEFKTIDDLLFAIEENPNLLATIIARINKSIIIGTEVLGKKIIFNPSEKLLSKILIVKIK